MMSFFGSSGVSSNSNMAEVSSALGAISNAFSLTLKITEKVYEIEAVDEEAKDLLETTNQINDLKPPPTYHESEWLYASRQKNLRRRASAVTLNGQFKSGSNSLHSPSPSIAELPDDSASMLEGESMPAVSDSRLFPPPFDDAGSIRSCPDSPFIVTPPEDNPRRLSGRTRNRSWLEYQSRRC